MPRHETRNQDGQYAKDKGKIGREPMVARPGEDYVSDDCETVERQNERKKGSR